MVPTPLFASAQPSTTPVSSSGWLSDGTRTIRALQETYAVSGHPEVATRSLRMLSPREIRGKRTATVAAVYLDPAVPDSTLKLYLSVMSP